MSVSGDLDSLVQVNQLEVNVEALRKCEPPYEGNSDEELVQYLYNNVYMDYDFYENEHNQEVYGEDAVYQLSMEEVYDMEEFFDSRNKGEDAFIQVGTPDTEYTKHGGFNATANGTYEY